MKIICVGRNYVEHVHELGNEITTEPLLFIKPATALLVNGALKYPAFTKNLHYECELVLKVSKAGFNVLRGDAEEYYEEISLGIDFTARDIQDKLKGKGLPWEKAKAFDGSAVVGHFIDKDHFKDIRNAGFQLIKNGITVQDGNTALMIYTIDVLIEEITKYFTIEPGDLIFTGTPKGVGSTVKGDTYKGILGDIEVLASEIV
ncbi:fumarylacetoacetate hydrolase family protein [Polluticaenibacter yanchengensis]|uniref:Fumarylacetoacetate hydrolase family protein n=1 Tax=Polluticaenibacter yanchengensis TaxID=3014562 RepID=A0ABT4UIR9_9BACT|nr:fumarylacetoacetate hydrolase family protein [Chitinophagaceae bacterium LY-5]